MKKLLLAAAMTLALSAPAFANQCPALMAKIDEAMKTATVDDATKAKVIDTLNEILELELAIEVSRERGLDCTMAAKTSITDAARFSPGGPDISPRPTGHTPKPTKILIKPKITHMRVPYIWQDFVRQLLPWALPHHGTHAAYGHAFLQGREEGSVSGHSSPYIG